METPIETLVKPPDKSSEALINTLLAKNYFQVGIITPDNNNNKLIASLSILLFGNFCCGSLAG